MAVYRVEVSFKPGVLDAEGEATREALKSLGFAVKGVKTSKVYAVEFEGGEEEVKKMCEKLLANPIIHDFKVSKA